MKASLLIAAGLALAAAGAAPAGAATHTQTVRDGALRAEFSYPGSPLGKPHPRLRIYDHGKLIVDRRGLARPAWTYNGKKAVAARVLSIRQLDGAGPKEVLVEQFSGGAHCCWETWIYSGKRRTVASWGHGPPALKDADGDGKPEFHGYDTRFAYAFGSFAGSLFPAAVWRYAGGRVENVSAAYPAEVQADFDAQHARYVEARDAASGEGVRSALAAYAADGYHLGQGDQAMAVVQAAVDAGEVDTDRYSDFTFWKPDYIGTLRTMLHDLGYAP